MKPNEAELGFTKINEASQGALKPSNKSIQIQFIKANEPLLRQKKTWLVKALVLWVDLLG